jgi:hypothetical protein
MATTVKPMTELAMKLRLSQQAKDKLTQRAAESGRDVDAVASELIEQAVTQPTPGDSLDQAEIAKSLTMIEQSFQDIRANRTGSAKQAIGEIAEEFGLSLERRSVRG